MADTTTAASTAKPGSRRFLVASAVLAIVAGVGLAAVWLAAEPGMPAGTVSAPPATAHTLGSADPLKPLPPLPDLPPAKLRLGEKLFYETRLSSNNQVACVSCHDLAHGGADRRRYSVGVSNVAGAVNAPSVFNASLNLAQFWDGRASTLEAQAEGPLLDPNEMGSSWATVIDKLRSDAGYKGSFNQVYTDGITPANVLDAIASFERSLLTPNSPFDRYLQGIPNSLNALELDGYRRFRDYGCASCHQGSNVGGNMYQRFGVMADYFANRKLTRADLGRYNVTSLEEDRFVFKVPSLRNVALTAPYFHDGSASTLEQAVTTMGRYQLGRELGPDDVRALTAFLKSLTGEWRGRALQ